MSVQDALQSWNWDAISATIALFSLVVSVVAVLFTIKSRGDARRSADASERSATAAEKSVEAAERSATAAEKSVTTNLEMFKKQGVMDLFESWQDLRDIDPSRPITPDIIRAAKALELTASLWNHDIVKREILHQSFWDDFKHLYDRLNHIGQVPGLNRTGAELLTRRVRKAYKEMDEFDTSKEASSKLEA